MVHGYAVNACRPDIGRPFCSLSSLAPLPLLWSQRAMALLCSAGNGKRAPQPPMWRRIGEAGKDRVSAFPLLRFFARAEINREETRDRCP